MRNLMHPRLATWVAAHGRGGTLAALAPQRARAVIRVASDKPRRRGQRAPRTVLRALLAARDLVLTLWAIVVLGILLTVLGGFFMR